MSDLPARVTKALNSDCAADLEEILYERRADDFVLVQGFIASERKAGFEHRARAIYLLGRWGDPAAVPTILNILPQLDDRGRIAAIDALGRFGTQEAVAAVIENSRHPSPQIRKIAVHVLGRFDSGEAKERLRETERTDSNALIRKLASKALAGAGSNPR
ncbi:HEAT repeat domain-containing protein [Belnapia moabensis]|uniref:HEAT repeat domain-containing protein n=1 Tax=Belnapia moabensis TaxID=365533 RepID=UPI000A05EA8C|nr:HEAT repeat domain-containing protein [Belnapia moabensis]